MLRIIFSLIVSAWALAALAQTRVMPILIAPAASNPCTGAIDLSLGCIIPGVGP